MDLGLQDKVALVTGAARGIGWAEAQALAQEGAQLVLVDLDAQALRAACDTLIAGGNSAVCYVGDAADEDDVARILHSVHEQFRGLDLLVNNAGIGVKPAYRVADMPTAAWDSMVQMHMRSTFLWSRGAVPLMSARGFGRIVNTSSMNFTGGGRPGVAHYAAAKAGIVGFTQTLAKEVARQGITVNAIAPGYVATELIAQFTEPMRALLQEQNPVGRLCQPQEVAALVAFLCSTQAAFINGELICLDGGRRDFYWGPT